MQNLQETGRVQNIKELEELLGKLKLTDERYKLAHEFKFLSQFQNPKIYRPTSFENIKYKKYYSDHSKALNKLHFIFFKYKIDSSDFLKYILKETGIYTPELILNPELFLRYANHKNKINKFSEIHERYMKSINSIANICIERNLSPKEYIRYLIVENKLAYEFISGRISKYFIVSIQNFKELYSFLDDLNKDELRIIYNAVDELRVMVDEAFISIDGTPPRPLKLIEEVIKQIKIK